MSLTSDFIKDFTASLPAAYRQRYDSQAVESHAQVSIERSDAPANVGTFASPRGPGTALCVVADDRPGLLAAISAALLLCDLDVIDAEAYTRYEGGKPAEAVDIFWVRHSARDRRLESVGNEVIDKVRACLVGLLGGKLPAPARLDFEKTQPSETVVRFLESPNGGFSTLEVETGDRSGLLLALATALFQQRVQIQSSEVRTSGDRVFDRFNVVEFDGAPIGPTRRLEIQVAVLSAIDPAGTPRNTLQ